MIEFKNLMIKVEDKLIINDFNLEVLSGELHVIMGPNGSGKSTLANTIAGHPKYSIKNGSITYKKKLINKLSPEERSALGIFLSLQYPVSIPGVKNIYFLKAAINNVTTNVTAAMANPALPNSAPTERRRPANGPSGPCKAATAVAVLLIRF